MPKVPLLKCLLVGFLVASSAAAAPAPYSHGDPSDHEQLYLEFINQARASIDDEVTRLSNTSDPEVLSAIAQFEVDLDLMATQFENLKNTGDDGAIPIPGNTQMPLAFNPMLIEVSRLHSQDMFDHVFQGHTSSSQPTPPIEAEDGLGERAGHVGYVFAGINENVYSSAKSVWHGHAAFNIDWGFDTGGMQDPPGHRWAIHHPDRREAGVGVILGSRSETDRSESVTVSGTSSFLSDVGPQVVTQVFARQLHAETGMDVPFLTGVAYLDIDGNDFYSLNEGLGGLTITVDGADYYATTSASGGYAIPLPNEEATYSVSISGPGFESVADSFTVAANLHNVKWDFSPAFTLPTPDGPTDVIAGATNSYSYNPLPGSSAYQVRVSSLNDAAWVEDATDPDGPFLITQTEGYEVRQSFSKHSGTHAFRLATVDTDALASQIVEIDRDLIPTASSRLEFQSRRGISTTDQVAYAEISADDGQSWTALYSIAGFEEFEKDAEFSLQSLSLTDYADQVVRIRFRYTFDGGAFYEEGTTDSGWYVDDITVTDSRQVVESASVAVEDTEFGFTPPGEGLYLLEATGINGERIFPFGAPRFVSASGPGGDGGLLAHSISGTGVEPEPEPETRVLGLAGDLEFGTVEIGQSADRILTLSNSGNATLTVTNITYPDGYTGNWSDGAIAPGGIQDVVVTFTPDVAANFEGTINITADQTTGQTSIAVSGAGSEPEPEPEPDTRILGIVGDLNFGTLEVGQSANRILTLSNSGNDTLTVTAISLPSGFGSDWTAGTIAPGETREITITFAPDTSQSYGGSITITSDQTDGENTIAVSGEAQAAEPEPEPEPEVDAPVINTDLPADFAIRSGRRIFLSVGAEGEGDPTFQWYRGSAGDTTDPIAGANDASCHSGPIEAVSTFWVRVSNSGGGVDSSAVTVSVAAEPPARSFDQSQIDYDPGFIVAFDLWQAFAPQSEYLAAVDLALVRRGNPGDLSVAIADAEGRLLMQSTIAQDQVAESTRWLRIPFGIFLDTARHYRLLVRAPENGDSEEHYFVWRGARGDPYPAGTTNIVGSEPELDFAFRTIAGADQGRAIPMDDEELLGNGWRRSTWLGNYYGEFFEDGDHGWIYHQQHGWLWLDSRAAPEQGFFIYDAVLGWLWTRESLYPWLYDYQEGWLFYERDSQSPRWFFSLSDGIWIDR